MSVTTKVKLPSMLAGAPLNTILAGVSAQGGDAAGDGALMFMAPLPQRTSARVRSEAAAHGPGAALELVAAANELAYTASNTNAVARLSAYHPAGAAARREVGSP